MKCKDCKYYSSDGDTVFCDSRNHKRKTVRIKAKDAERDMNCYWSDELVDERKGEVEQ